jgi:hypothetical protein
MRVMDDGTPRALAPLAQEVLAWVAHERKKRSEHGFKPTVLADEDLRRIELCAQSVISYDRLITSMGES